MYIIQLRGCITDMVRLFFCLPQTWWIRIFAVRTLSRKDLPSDILKKEKSFSLKKERKGLRDGGLGLCAKSPERRKVPKESTQGFLRSGKRDIRREMRERMSERYERAYEGAEENSNLCARKGLCKKTCESKETQGAFCRKKSHACAGIAKFHKRWLKSLKIPCGNGIL